MWPGGFGAPVGSWSLRGDGAEHVDASGPAAGQDGGGQAGDCVGSAYVTYYPDLAVDGAAEAVGTFADLAVATGRTALKFTLVWELAHTAVWNMLAWPGDGGSVVDMVLLGVANAVIVVDLVSLFVGTRRTPYDRITGTLVTTTG